MSGYQPIESFEAPSAVEDDLRCASCGYNLRGLSTDMRCPECGTPIERSARGNFLRYSDPVWVSTLARGTSLMRWGILISIFLGILGVVGVGVLTASGALTPSAILVLSALLSIIGQGLLLWAAFLVTTQEPRVSLEEDTVTARRLVRSCAVLSFVGSFIQSITPVTSGSKPMLLLLALGTVLTLAGVVGFFAQFVYFRRFALRIPDARLAESTRTVMWGFVISYGVIIVFGLVTLIASSVSAATPGAAPVGPGWTAAGGGLVMCAGLVAALIFACWAYRLLLKYVRAFKAAAIEAAAVGH